MYDARRVSSLFLLSGAACGLYVMFTAALATSGARALPLVIIGLLAFGYFGLAGWRLRQQHPTGRTLGLIALALQIPMLDLPVARYLLHAPAVLSLVVQAELETTFTYAFGATARFAWWPRTWAGSVGVNLLALGLWVWLYRTPPSSETRVRAAAL